MNDREKLVIKVENKIEQIKEKINTLESKQIEASLTPLENHKLRNFKVTLEELQTDKEHLKYVIKQNCDIEIIKQKILSMQMEGTVTPLVKAKGDQEKVTANEFLSIKMPTVLYGKKKTIMSSSARSNPRIPNTVTHWTDFRTDAASFAFPAHIGSTIVSAPQFKVFKRPIYDEKRVNSAIDANISEILTEFQSEISDNPFIFTTQKMSQIKETNQNNVVYSFIEAKTKFDIPTPQKRESLVSWWKKDYAYEIGKSKVKRSGKSIFHEITQIYGYLSDNSLRYGILTTYECTWFIYRPHPTIMKISCPFACDGESPTLIKAYCYFLSLLNENHITERIPRVTPALKRKRLQTVEINHKIDTRAAKKFKGEIPDDFSIEDLSVSRCLGQGACGSVYEWDYNGKPAAVKLCDFSNNKNGYEMMKKEVHVYKKLVSLQGRTIPEFFFSGHISNFFVISTFRINGKPLQNRNDNYQQQIDSICNEMRTLGIVHTDLRESNILLDQDNQIWIIDFGKCDII